MTAKPSRYQVGRGKFLDAFSDRNSTSTTSNITNTDSGNRTETTSNIMENVGNTPVTIGPSGSGNDPLEKLLPIVLVGGLVIAGLAALGKANK
jgi:hypothetical protein